MRVRDRVAVGWIDGGQVDGLFAVSMLNLFTARSARISTVIRVGGSLLARQRNEVVQTFLDKNDAEWLFFIDTDETISLESFDKLLDAAHDKDRPVVAGLYFAAWATDDMYPHPTPMIMREGKAGGYVPVWDFPEDGVIPIDAAGTGALLIHRSVLERIRAESNAGPLGVHEGGKWCWFRDMAAGGEWWGEDIFFCRRVRDLGFPIVAATGCRLDHHKSYWLSGRHYRGPWKEWTDGEEVESGAEA
jgi:hypothetical protein